MIYYELQPEVPGQLDVNTVLKPPRSDFFRQVDYLHIRIEGWLGDDLMEIHPCYIITESLRDALATSNLSGFEIDHVEVSIDEQLVMFPNMAASWPIPLLYRLNILGYAGREDFGLTSFDAPISLVVSDQAINLLRSFHVDNCEISKYGSGLV